MTGKVHVTIGVASVLCLFAKYPTGVEIAGVAIQPVIAMATAAAGSYAPDIDMGTTHAGRKHKNVSKVVSKVGGGHRGITHTLLVPTVLACLMFYTNTSLNSYPALCTSVVSLIAGFEFGWIMHIFADLFNGKGCPLLWPIVRSKISIMDLPSSGFVPWMFAVFLISIMGFISFGGVFG